VAEGRVFIGHVEILALTDVEVDLPIPLSQLHPTVPPEAWAPFRQRYPEVFGGPDTWHIHFGGYLLRSQGRTILVEAEAATLAACHYPAPGFGRLIRVQGRGYWQGL
jgi:hypothetical protein